MKNFKRIVLVFGGILLLLFFGVLGFIFYMKPQYEGELHLKNLEKETTVYFDEFGIPHIYASSQKDAMLALGYVHAQDRLWQMELMRRIASGRLAEIFGKVALDNDRFFVGLGIEEASAKAIAQLDKNNPSYVQTMAYLNGINQYLKEGVTPVEFQILGIKKQQFTLKDVYNIYGYMAFSFAMGQKTDPLLSDIKSKLGPEYLKDFGLNGEFNTTQIKSTKSQSEDYATVSKSIAALLEKMPVAAFVGSNSWVVGGAKTRSGKVIFANDPHIGFSQPGTWYEAHLVTPDYEIYGCYLAGTPFPLLAHNREYSYGLTMFENDDVDFYEETNNVHNENQYQTPNGFENYTTRTKIIKVKDSSDVVLNVKLSRHGPLMNDLLVNVKSEKPLAMSWIYTQEPILLLDAVYGLSHAKSKEDFKKAVELVAAPGLNVMYGDAKGNVAWWATGKLYKHDKRVNTNFVLNGASGKDDIIEYLDFDKNPSAENPESGYVYSANNQPEAVDGYLYPGYYLPEDRAKRITQLLDAKSDWDKKSVSTMMFDNTSIVAPEVIQKLVKCIEDEKLTPNESEVISILTNWKGTHELEDLAPTIYNKWIYLYLKNTFEDELGKEDFQAFLGTHLMKQIIAKQLDKEQSIWWDNVTTANVKERKNDIISKSFYQAVSDLEKQLGTNTSDWQWKNVHTVEYGHPLGTVKALRRIFNVGPFATSGSNEVIDNQFFSFSKEGNYKVTGGPSTRRVVDFADIENSWSILPTGQSGNPFSKHYKDQALLYNAGKYRKMKLNKEEILKSSTKLVFKTK